MLRLNNFIFKKYYFSLTLQNIFLNFPYLLFLKYDSISSVILNKFRKECIIHSFNVYLVNSKYINGFFIGSGSLTKFNFLKNDIILIPFSTLNSLQFFLFNQELSFFFTFFKIIGVSFKGYLLNLRFYSLFGLLKNDNSFFFLKKFIDFLFYNLVYLIKILILMLLNLINLFIFNISLLNKSNFIVIL